MQETGSTGPISRLLHGDWPNGPVAQSFSFRNLEAEQDSMLHYSLQFECNRQDVMRLSPTPKQSTNLRILKSLRSRLIRVAAVGLIATAILGTSGCKSVPFSLPKPSLPKLPAPNLSKLAFWKSENLIAKKGNLPKPPSLSFDSSPARQAIASSNGSASREIQSLRNQIASTKAQLTEPVREPYKYAAKNTLNKLADKAKVDLDSGSSSRNGLPKANIVDSKITQAQRDFQAALARTKKAGNDFSLPNGIKSAKSNANKSLMAVNKSLYNADGKPTKQRPRQPRSPARVLHRSHRQMPSEALHLPNRWHRQL